MIYSFSALEDEPWIEADCSKHGRRVSRIVSVLLKTSRGLKLIANSDPCKAPCGFSALEDEPWIEAEVVTVALLRGQGFSALEDEPWIEAVSTLQLSAPYERFQCS